MTSATVWAFARHFDIANPNLSPPAIKIQALARGKRDRKRLKVEEKPAKQDSTKKFGSSLNVYNKGPLRVLHPNPATSKSFKHTEHKQGHDELESSGELFHMLVGRDHPTRLRKKTTASLLSVVLNTAVVC
jgi:hypothetical protein